MITDKIRSMLEHSGVYVGVNNGVPQINVIILSVGGKLFAAGVGSELDPEKPPEGFTFHGPYRGDTVEEDRAQYYSGRADMLNEIITKLKEYDAHRSAQIAASVAVNPEELAAPAGTRLN